MHEILKRKIDNARAYLQEKKGAARRRDARYKQTQEIRLRGKTFSVFTRQMNWTIDKMQQLSVFQTKGVIMVSRKTIFEEIDDLVSEMPYNDQLVNNLAQVVQPTYKKGARTIYKELAMAKQGVDFSLVNIPAAEYVERLKTLHLSDYRGSISHETKIKIRNIITDQINEGASYQQAAQKIREQGEAGVFSKARAELIAVNQVGGAYGEGNHEMIDQFKAETHSIMQKEWITTGDDRVTEECQANQREGWLNYEENFSSGDSFAPRSSNPRCRCDTGYRAVDTQGNPI